MSTAVDLDQASVRYPDGRGVEALSARLDVGRTVALVGPSGAGKSTLLQLVAGTIAPDSGSVRTLGQPIAELRGDAYRAAAGRVGLLGQADDLTPGLSVLHNVFAGRLGRWSAARALRNRVWPRADDRRDVQAALVSAELAGRIDADPAELSGGERRRVALARLGFQGPSLWLADEPTTGLDVRLRTDMMDLLLKMVRDADATAIVALHDLELLRCDFDEVWGLRRGTLEFMRPAQDVSEVALESLFGASR
ncbi:MAG: ATP-binding cassette domain-containing protein [Nannocystaceae bacterium]|nr:ATP-binding cassette domain-containing protein [Nannocystaceae bacterium]